MFSRVIGLSVLLLWVFAPAWAAEAPWVPGHLLVGQRQGAEPELVDRALRLHRAVLSRHFPQIGASVLEVPEDSSAAIAESLRRTGLFDYVERDYYAHTAAAPAVSTAPDDPSYPSQWHLARIQAPSAWTVTTGSPSIVVAVVDSGVDATHPDLVTKLVPGWSFLNSNSDTADVTGHGTAVAGTLAAATNNGIGGAGVTWSSLIMPLAVLDSGGSAAYSNIAAAIEYAADQGVRVINVSLGGPNSSVTLQNAVNYAWNRGALVFAAAMNDGSSAPNYPAACNHALAVSATDAADSLAGFSNYGSWIALSAPGVNILTTSIGGGYSYWAGTSFSTPIVAGVAALALAANPSLTNAALAALLEDTADDIGVPGFDNSFGWGRVNAYRAVSAARPPTAFAPIRVNAGGPAYVDSLGQAWSADANFAGGSTGSVSGSIAHTASPTLYQTCRSGSSFGYQFAVPNGAYTVNLKFAETVYSAPGLRRFNVSLNSASALADFDVFAAAGGAFTAVDRPFPVAVTAGHLTILFTSGAADWPMVGAIEVLPGISTPAPAPRRPFEDLDPRHRAPVR